MNSSSLSSNQLIANRYEVARFLGFGGSGRVYECKDIKQGFATVALKLFPPALKLDRIATLRAVFELRAAFRVDHDNVVKLYEPIVDGDTRGYTMELVPGKTLEEHLKIKGRYSEQEALQILIQICSGLRAIHDASIIHSDLKPANILISEAGVVKITDFGVAQELRAYAGAEERRLLRSGNDESRRTGTDLIGTPDYISPEQVFAGTCDQRSDLYALGVIAYQLMTGQLPFQADQLSDLMELKRAGVTKPVSSIVQCSHQLNQIILQLLNPRPSKRYRSANKVLDELVMLWLYSHSSDLAEVNNHIQKRKNSLLVRYPRILFSYFARMYERIALFLSETPLKISGHKSFLPKDLIRVRNHGRSWFNFESPAVVVLLMMIALGIYLLGQVMSNKATAADANFNVLGSTPRFFAPKKSSVPIISGSKDIKKYKK